MIRSDMSDRKPVHGVSEMLLSLPEQKLQRLRRGIVREIEWRGGELRMIEGALRRKATRKAKR